MESHIQARLNEIRQKGYTFNLGDYISKGFNVFGKQAGLFIGFTVIVFLISMVAGFIPIIGPLANQLYLSPCLMAGFFLMSYKIITNQQPQSFNDMFSGFKQPLQLILWALISLAISIIVLLPLIFATGLFSSIMEFAKINMSGGQPDPEDVIEFIKSAWIYFLIVYLVFIIIYTFLAFTLHFIIIGKLQVIEAMKASALISSKNYLMVLLMFIILGLFIIVGILPCFLGLLVAIPVMYTTTTSAFCDIMQIGKEGEAAQSFANDGLLDS